MEEKTAVKQAQVAQVINGKKNRSRAAKILNDPEKAEELVKKINSKLLNIPYVGVYFADVPTLCLMVTDYAKKNYRQIPFAAIVGIVVALVYFLTPIDLIPDVLPGIGQLDDAAVLLFAVKAAHNDIADYKKWKGL